MKYASGDEKVRTLIAKRHPFKGVENYFTDFLLYQASLKADENPYPEELDSGNEVDTEAEEDKCLWEINTVAPRPRDTYPDTCPDFSIVLLQVSSVGPKAFHSSFDDDSFM